MCLSLCVCVAVCQFAYISVAVNGQILVKFDIGDFDENLLRNSKFVKNWAKVSHILHEDPSKFASGNINSP
jgi:hypothetical protein